jgi:hypothetical protein
MSLPRWATAPTKDAVATAQGWKSPKGELLVSHKDLEAKIKLIGGKGTTTPVEKTVDVATEAAKEVGEAVNKMSAPFKKKKKK